MKYFAHSGQQSDKSDWQPLDEHLIGAAALALEMGGRLGLEQIAGLAALLHDVGKYSPEFQKRLEGGPSVDHSTAGAKILLERTDNADRLMAELAAYAILGHHAGLPDRLNATAACFDRRIEDYDGRIDPIWERELDARFTGLAPKKLQLRGGDDRKAFRLSVLGRMIFSCLVDADFKETEGFYAQLTGRPQDRTWPKLPDLLPDLVIKFNAHMDEFKQRDALGRLRRETLEHIRSKAGATPGLFTLTVPTGGGKTLASLGFALDHAKAHGLRRIIYAIPFTSIIEQTAEVFRSVLGDEIILEHHSTIEEGNPDGFGGSQRRNKMRLAMEDWAAPVVVTTNVQFFESLFAARPSRARKLHNIAGSVIVLDEAQTLPRGLLMPVMRMLEELCEVYGCTVVLCTATQPALDERNLECGLALEGRELVPDPTGLSTKLRRTTIRHGGAMTNDDLATALRAHDQALLIVNSRKHALELYRDCEAAGLEGLVHLTTRQCAAHRRLVLKDVRVRLKIGAPCRVIATSLVEAGVDVDFPRVWRAEAGLDQIVQAAGRCNRENRWSPEASLVTVFSAPDYAPPSEIKSLASDLARVWHQHEDLLSLSAIEAYFREVYWREGTDGLDRKNILGDFWISRRGVGRTGFSYRTAAEKFRMIEDGQATVIVAFDDKAKDAVEKLSVEAISSGVLARRLQSYIVQLRPEDRNLLMENGHAAFAAPRLRGEQFAVLRTDALYCGDTGLLWENGDYLATERLFF